MDPNESQEMEMTESSVKIEVLKGRETIPYLQNLSALRISFYREYPYLYDGNSTDEERQLSLYANSENSLLVIAKKGVEVVGAMAGLPLQESNKEEDKKLFAGKGFSPKTVFYLGESVLLPEYFKSTVQQRLFQHFEEAILGLKTYNTIAVCEVERDVKDPKKPLSHLSSEVRWDDKGFIKQQDLNTHYVWRDIGDLENTKHLMTFWTKAL